jgi:hypothetical protein
MAFQTIRRKLAITASAEPGRCRWSSPSTRGSERPLPDGRAAIGEGSQEAIVSPSASSFLQLGEPPGHHDDPLAR